MTVLSASGVQQPATATHASRRYWPVRILVGAMLLTAAALKAYELASGSVAGTGPLASRGVLLAVVEFEWVLGLCLLSGVWPRATWLVAVVCFAGFTGITLYKLLAGEASCGCFGKVAIHPRYTLLLDLAALAALLLYWPGQSVASASVPSGRKAGPSGRKAAWVLLLAAGVGIPAGVLMSRESGATLAADGSLADSGGLIVLDPADWIGRPFPLLKHIDIGPRLREGRWMVVLFHHDCSECQAALPRYRQLALAGTPVALVEVPPYGYQADEKASKWAMGKLANTVEWFVRTPVEIELEGGVVRHVRQ